MSQKSELSIMTLTLVLELFVLFVGWGLMVASYIHGLDSSAYTIFSVNRISKNGLIIFCIKIIFVFTYDALIHLPDLIPVLSHAFSGKAIIVWGTTMSLILVGIFGYSLGKIQQRIDQPYRRSNDRYRD